MKTLTLSFLMMMGHFICGCANKQTEPKENQIILGTNITAEDLEYKKMPAQKIKELNDNIEALNLDTEIQIMQFYSPEQQTHNQDYLYVLTRKPIKKDSLTMKITLLEDCIESETCLKAKKVIMILDERKGKLFVTDIQESYQCYLNQGSSEWSAQQCQ